MEGASGSEEVGGGGDSEWMGEYAVNAPHSPGICLPKRKGRKVGMFIGMSEPGNDTTRERAKGSRLWTRAGFTEAGQPVSQGKNESGQKGWLLLRIL